MKYLSGLIFVLSVFFADAQSDEKYDELVILFADAKYEKLIDQAEKLANKEDNKKDPEPYMWLSKAYYKISLSGTMDPAFKNAYKSSLKAMEKVIKLDKDTSCIKKNSEFIEELQNSLKELIVNDLAVEDFKKAAGWAQQYSKISYNSVGAEYLVAASKFRSGDKTGAKTLFKKCDDIIASTTSIESWVEADIVLLKEGALQSAECYLASKQLDKAMELLNTLKPWYSDDEDFNQKYIEFTN